MTASDIRNLLARHLAAEAVHDAAGAAACYADDGFYVNTALGLRFDGRAAVGLQYAGSYAAMPDLALEVDGEVFEGARVVQWGRFTATANGSFFGLPPTGRRLSVALAAVYELDRDAILGETLFYDLAAFCDQSGWDLRAVQAAVSALPPSMRIAPGSG
jgi:steroid delta-isomerase-like uncharacterized protein